MTTVKVYKNILVLALYYNVVYAFGESDKAVKHKVGEYRMQILLRTLSIFYRFFSE